MAESSTDQIQYVAAAPGNEVLVYQPDSKTFETHPVVAWAILLGDDESICAQPITVAAWDINDPRAVRGPSGEVVCDDRYWITAEVWLAEMNAAIADAAVAMAVPDVALSDRPGVVLALNNFRDKFRGGQ